MNRSLIVLAALSIAAAPVIAQQAPGGDTASQGAPKAAAKKGAPGGTTPQPIRGSFPGPGGKPPAKLDPRAAGKG